MKELGEREREGGGGECQRKYIERNKEKKRKGH